MKSFSSRFTDEDARDEAELERRQRKYAREHPDDDELPNDYRERNGFVPGE